MTLTEVSIGVQHVALRRLETKKMGRIYKINKMRRKKINPVDLVNPVYFGGAFMWPGEALKE
jgi:hypothetical protein